MVGQSKINIHSFLSKFDSGMGLLKQSSLDSVRIEEVIILFLEWDFGLAIKVQMTIDHNYLETGFPSKGCSVTLPHC